MDGTRNSLHDTPLYAMLRREWRRLERRIDTVQVAEDDLLLYLLWTIDTLRDGAETAELWNDIRHELRRRFLADKFTPSGSDLDVMADIVCALTLHCLGLLLTGSMERRELYSQIVHDLGDRWPQVREVKNSLSTADLQQLKAWLTEYYVGEVFYTVGESMEWDEETCGEMSLERKMNNAQVHIENYTAMGETTFKDSTVKQYMERVEVKK